MFRCLILQKTSQKRPWIYKLKIHAASTAVQNYFNQQNIPVKEEKNGVEEFHPDDKNLGKLNHFKIESPFQPTSEPERLTEAEQTSLNLLFPGKNEQQFNRHYMESLQKHAAGTFLDVKG